MFTNTSSGGARGGGGGLTIVGVPSAGGAGGSGGTLGLQMMSGATQTGAGPSYSQLGPGLSDEKRREMKERMKRLTKGVKKLEEQLSSVDINNLTKIKKLMEIVEKVEKDKYLDIDERLIQKCEKAVKKFLQKSQQEKQ